MGFSPRVTLADAAAIAAAAAERHFGDGSALARSRDARQLPSVLTIAGAVGLDLRYGRRRFLDGSSRASIAADLSARRRLTCTPWCVSATAAARRRRCLLRRQTVARIIGLAAFRQNLRLLDPLLSVDPAGNAERLADALYVRCGPSGNVFEIVDAFRLQPLFEVGVDGANALEIVTAFDRRSRRLRS